MGDVKTFFFYFKKVNVGNILELNIICTLPCNKSIPYVENPFVVDCRG